LIKNHTPLFKRRQKLIKAESLETFVQDCKGLPYYEPLSQALEKYKQDKQLSHFEHHLNRFFKKSMLEEQSFHQQGPYPLFAFFLKKELEMKNLITISKGVSSKMPPEKIKRLLI
jgi:vacuolar-type H+-ATPase subunit C/Vma6